MAKRVFFSFHYQDVIDFRANVVRQHWMTKSDREEAGFFDASIWESAKRTGTTTLKRLINGGLEGTSTTCVLVGSGTWSRPWVRYEIMKSYRRGNRIFAVHINELKGKDQKTKPLGINPLTQVGVSFSTSGDTGTLWHIVNGQWLQYTEIDGAATFRTGGIDQQFWGKSYNFSSLLPCYNWISNDGYNKFSTWVG